MKNTLFLCLILIVLLLGGCGSGGSTTGTSGSGSTGTSGSGSTTVPTISGGSLGAFNDLGDLFNDPLNNWFFTDAVALNDNGTIVGASTSSPVAFKWLSAGGIMTSLGGHPAQYYDDYYGGAGTQQFVYSHAIDVNNKKWIIGDTVIGKTDGVYGDGRAFVIDDTPAFIDLAPLTENKDTGVYDVIKDYSHAIEINDNNYVILDVDDDSGRHGYYWDGTTYVTNATTGAVPKLVKIPGILGQDSSAVAISGNNKMVVNSGDTAVFSDPTTSIFETLNKYINDSTLAAADINNSGQIVGQSGTLGFFWEAGSMTRINSLGGSTCEPKFITNTGLVVGDAATSSGATHGFTWKLNADGSSTMTDLGTLGGSNSYVTGVNESGVIVGYSETGDTFVDATGTYVVTHGFIWKNGVIYDLGVHNDFYNYPFIDSYPFSKAVGINASGTVIGNSTSPNANSRGFTITPVYP